MYEMTGTVVKVGETQTFGQKGFTKRTLVVKEETENAKYPNIVAFTLMRDRCSLADSLTKNAKVKITFAVNGRVWDRNGDGRDVKYFTDLAVFKIELLEKGKPVPPPATPTDDDITYEDAEDVPF